MEEGTLSSSTARAELLLGANASAGKEVYEYTPDPGSVISHEGSRQEAFERGQGIPGPFQNHLTRMRLSRCAYAPSWVASVCAQTDIQVANPVELYIHIEFLPHSEYGRQMSVAAQKQTASTCNVYMHTAYAYFLVKQRGFGHLAV